MPSRVVHRTKERSPTGEALAIFARRFGAILVISSMAATVEVVVVDVTVRTAVRAGLPGGLSSLRGVPASATVLGALLFGGTVCLVLGAVQFTLLAKLILDTRDGRPVSIADSLRTALDRVGYVVGWALLLGIVVGSTGAAAVALTRNGPVSPAVFLTSVIAVAVPGLFLPFVVVEARPRTIRTALAVAGRHPITVVLALATLGVTQYVLYVSDASMTLALAGLAPFVVAIARSMVISFVLCPLAVAYRRSDQGSVDLPRYLPVPQFEAWNVLPGGNVGAHDVPYGVPVVQSRGGLDGRAFLGHGRPFDDRRDETVDLFSDERLRSRQWSRQARDDRDVRMRTDAASTGSTAAQRPPTRRT